MIPVHKEGFTKEAMEVLNGYPAFAEAPYNYIEPSFFDEAFRKWVDTGKDTTPRVCKRYVDSLCCEPGKASGRSCKDTRKPFSEAEAWELLSFMEPLWCKYRGIDSTGYLSNTGLQTAAELLDDDMLDI